MKELDYKDLENISGGLAPLIYGIAGAYAYEGMGGKAGIDRYFSNGWASTKSSIRYWYRKLN